VSGAEAALATALVTALGVLGWVEVIRLWFDRA